MPSTQQHIATRSDIDLAQRFIAKAEMMGIPTPATFVNENMVALIQVEVGGTQTITDVYAYASEVRSDYIRNTPPAPGLNPGAVTDDHLATAITAVFTPPAPE